MTGAMIKVNAKDIEAAAGRMLDLSTFDAAAMFDEIGAAMVTSTQDRFEKGVGPDGVEWTPSMRAIEEGGQTLVDHGHLRDSHAHKASSANVAWGTNDIRAAAHHFGGETGRNHATVLPARPALGLSAADNAEIREIVSDHLAGGLGA